MTHAIDEAQAAQWLRDGLWSDQSLAEVFERQARENPDARIVVAAETRPAEASLAEVFAMARRVAAGFRSVGLGRGDCIAVQAPNWLETLVANAAIALIGGVVVPIVHIYGPSELGYILGQSGAKALITPDRWRGVDFAERLARTHIAPSELLHIVIGAAPEGALSWAALANHPPIEAIARVAPDELALLIYTSGTTSAPKGVMHSHRTLLAELTAAPTTAAGSVALCPWPPGHVAGVLGMGRFWLKGQSSVLMERWDGKEAAELIAQHRIASTSGTPFHLSSLLDAAEAHGVDIDCLTDYLAGATMIPPSLIARCEARGLHTYRSYGMSEHPTISRGEASDPLDKRLNTDGRLCPGVEVMIVGDHDRPLPVGEAGEILSRGPDRFLGYSDPELNAAGIRPGGWLRTGDIGRLDADGFLSISDRKKDVIIRGGENIASREVEDLLLTLDGVRDAAVVGGPHPRLGEQVCAFLVLQPGAVVGLAEIDAHFAARGVARQKTPERIEIVDDLPRNAAGKVLKPELRARLAPAG